MSTFCACQLKPILDEEMQYIKIKIDADAGEATVELTDKFFEQSVIWQNDILSDVTGQLCSQWNRIVGEKNAAIN